MSYYGAYETYNAIMGVVSILVSAISLVAYIFQSIGLYSIAKRRGIKAPGLAWVPVGSMWILGSIADQFDYVRTGQVKKKRVALLWLTLVTFILTIIIFVSGYTQREKNWLDTLQRVGVQDELHQQPDP